MEAARGSDIIILATPANVVSDTVKEILPALRRNALLLDVCAVKSAVIPALRLAERRGAKVASIHPMFGPLARGVRKRLIIVVRTGKDGGGMKTVKRLFDGARIFSAEPEAHDRQMALTLALPHFLNMVFAMAICKRRSFAEIRKFAGRTFNLQMLLAETVASEPETTADIQIMNKDFAIILRGLQRDIRSLYQIVKRGDRAELVARYERIGQSLSVDPKFDAARGTFEKVCEMSSAISRW
jgi:prephenate dehydrogenase